VATIGTAAGGTPKQNLPNHATKIVGCMQRTIQNLPSLFQFQPGRYIRYRQFSFIPTARKQFNLLLKQVGQFLFGGDSESYISHQSSPVSSQKEYQNKRAWA
jgi:hypothetical protein